MSLRSLIIRHLEEAAGAYMPNHFLLLLDAGTPFIGGTDEVPRQDNRYLPVFTHEYWHYWQNVSTISGFKSFAFSQHFLAYFTPTLTANADGTSAGDTVLDSQAKADLGTLVAAQRDLDGTAAPHQDLTSDFELDFVVTGIRQRDAVGELRGRVIPNPIVEIDVEVLWPTCAKQTGSFHLGALAIEESVAFLVEEQIRTEIPNAQDAPPPVFPYRVVERVLQHLAGTVDPLAAAAIGTLSLLSPHPGLALVTMGRHYATALSTGATPEVALHAVQRAHRAGMVETIDRILASDIDELVGMHEGCGLMEGALKHITGTMRRALEARKRDPLFDLRFIFPRVRADALLAHQAEFPPCDLLQERVGNVHDVGRDTMHSFDGTPADENGHRPTDFTRSLQAQQHYLTSHLDLAAGEIVASSLTTSPCPYYTVCDLPLRTASPNTCASRPWEVYREAGDGCWYATAVSASLGVVQIRKRP